MLTVWLVSPKMKWRSVFCVSKISCAEYFEWQHVSWLLGDNHCVTNRSSHSDFINDFLFVRTTTTRKYRRKAYGVRGWRPNWRANRPRWRANRPALNWPETNRWRIASSAWNEGRPQPPAGCPPIRRWKLDRRRCTVRRWRTGCNDTTDPPRSSCCWSSCNPQTIRCTFPAAKSGSGTSRQWTVEMNRPLPMTSSWRSRFSTDAVAIRPPAILPSIQVKCTCAAYDLLVLRRWQILTRSTIIRAPTIQIISFIDNLTIAVNWATRYTWS